MGGATGMGAAAAQKAAALGAHTIVMDVADVAYECGQYININLVDQASVDAAVEAVTGPLGDTLLFLASDAASGINGVSLLVDQGHASASVLDVWDDPYVKVMAGMIEFDPAMFGTD